MKFKVKSYLKSSDGPERIRRFVVSDEGDAILNNLRANLEQQYPRILNGKPFTVNLQDANDGISPINSDDELRKIMQESTKEGNNLLILKITDFEKTEDGKKVPVRAKRRKLKNLVPPGHRYWFRVYCIRWRRENLSNSSSEGEDDEEVESKKDDSYQRFNHTLMHRFEIPKAYLSWVEIIVPRWHQKWGGERSEEGAAQMKKIPNEFKDSVPFAFRKYARIYMAKSFGKRYRPRFRGQNLSRFSRNDKRGRPPLPNKRRAALGRFQKFAKEVPVPIQRWTRTYIRNWRFKNLNNQESDDEAHVNARLQSPEKFGVPEDYPKWLDVLLPWWHKTWGGLDMEGVDESEHPKKFFRQTVPVPYRIYVRSYMNLRFGPRGKPRRKTSQ